MEGKFILEPMKETNKFPSYIRFIDHNNKDWKITVVRSQEELDKFKKPIYKYDCLFKDGVESFKRISTELL